MAVRTPGFCNQPRLVRSVVLSDIPGDVLEAWPAMSDPPHDAGVREDRSESTIGEGLGHFTPEPIAEERLNMALDVGCFKRLSSGADSLK